MVSSALAQVPATPKTGIELAKIEYEKIPPANRPLIRMVWSNGSTPKELDRDFIAVSAVCNMALNRSSVEYVPPRLAGNSLMLIDFSQLANTGQQLKYLLYVWDTKLASRDTFFHIHPVEKVVDQPKPTKGQKTTSPLNAITKVQLLHLPAPTLGPDAVALEGYVGNAYPTLKSYSPVVQAKWLTRVSLKSIDGGIYLDWLGIKSGETTTGEFLGSIGASLDTAVGNDSFEAFLRKSDVTGKPRKIRWWYGSNTRPSVALPLNSITDDFFNQSQEFDYLAGKKDPFDSPLDAKADGHELVFTLRNGWVGGVVANAQNKILASAPDKLVADRRKPDPHDTILENGLSCIRCHAQQRFWKPIGNEYNAVPLLNIPELLELKHQTVKDAGIVAAYGALFGSREFREYRQQVIQFSASDEETHQRILDARNSFEMRTFKTLHTHADDLLAQTAQIADEYEYPNNARGVDALYACADLGFVVDTKKDPLGIATFKQVVPANQNVAQGSAALFNRLIGTVEVAEQVPDEKNPGKTKLVMQQRGMTITIREWERIYQDAYTTAQRIHDARMAKPSNN